MLCRPPNCVDGPRRCFSKCHPSVQRRGPQPRTHAARRQAPCKYLLETPSAAPRGRQSASGCARRRRQCARAARPPAIGCAEAGGLSSGAGRRRLPGSSRRVLRCPGSRPPRPGGEPPPAGWCGTKRGEAPEQASEGTAGRRRRGRGRFLRGRERPGVRSPPSRRGRGVGGEAAVGARVRRVAPGGGPWARDARARAPRSARPAPVRSGPGPGAAAARGNSREVFGDRFGAAVKSEQRLQPRGAEAAQGLCCCIRVGRRHSCSQRLDDRAPSGLESPRRSPGFSPAPLC